MLRRGVTDTRYVHDARRSLRLTYGKRPRTDTPDANAADTSCKATHNAWERDRFKFMISVMHAPSDEN
jgi:hypothetical protein